MQGEGIQADLHFYRSHALQRGDIAVIRHNGLFLVKRIIALEGDTVSSDNQHLSVNGVPLKEDYVQHTDSKNVTPEMNTFAARSVPSGEVFVLGDNRDLSLDSRMAEFGQVTKKDVVGKVCFIANSNRGRTGNPL